MSLMSSTMHVLFSVTWYISLPCEQKRISDHYQKYRFLTSESTEQLQISALDYGNQPTMYGVIRMILAQ